MKTNLNRIAAAVVAGLVLFSLPAFSQTSVKHASPDFLNVEPNDGTSSAQGALLLGAGGARRVIARIGIAGPNMLRLQLANLVEYQTNISLTAADGAVRWEKTFSGEPGFASMIDLKALAIEPGDYYLRVQAGEAFLEQKIVVKNRETTLGAVRYSALAAAAMVKN